MPLVLVVLAAAALVYATRAREPVLRWTPLRLPATALNLESLVAVSGGFSLVSRPGTSGGAVWTTSDGASWSRLDLDRAPIRIAPDGAGLVAYDARTAFRITPTGAVRNIPLPDLLRTGYGSGRSGLVPGRRGIVAHSATGDVYRSANDEPFRLVVNAERWRTDADTAFDSRCSPPRHIGPDLPPTLATPDGFFAFVAAREASGVWPICEPVLWTSGDGSIWKQESTESPFGRSAYVADVDWSGGRFVAVGGTDEARPAVWISTDGLRWERRRAPAADRSYELVEVDGGPLGWVALGRFRGGPGRPGWVSADGTCWERLPAGVGGRTAAVGDTAIVIADRSVTARAWLADPATIPLPCR